MINHPSLGRRRLTFSEKNRKIQTTPLASREDQLQAFRDNLRRDAQSLTFSNIIHLYGQPGVGKTHLMHELAEVAREQEVLAVYVGEEIRTIPDLLYSIARQLAEKGAPLKSFSSQYERYCRLSREAETDPARARGWETMLTSALLAGDAPQGFDVAGAAPPIGPERERVAFFHRKFSHREDAHLLLEPETILTPRWVADLTSLAASHKICLLIDAYEQTGAVLDEWLRDVLDDRFGPFDANILLVLAGHAASLNSHWDDYRALTLPLPLEPFADGEAGVFLQQKGVTHGQLQQIICQLSGKLPLWLATLAAVAPEKKGKKTAGSAAEQFLEWLPEDEMRSFVLAAALPRRLTADLAPVLRESPDADDRFAWLCSLPFMEEKDGGWRCHPLVRIPLLRYYHQTDPKGFAGLHARLAAWFRERDGKTIPDGPSPERNGPDAFYHQFCQDPRSFFPSVIRQTAASLSNDFATTLPCLHALQQAEEDLAMPDRQRWSRRLTDGLRAEAEGNPASALALVDALLASDIQDEPLTTRLLLKKSIHLLNRKQWEEARATLGQVLERDPGLTDALLLQGFVHLINGKEAEALTTLDKATVTPWLLRGFTLTRLHRPEEALDHFDQALARQPACAEAAYLRGRILFDFGRFEAALDSYNQALEHHLKNSAVFRHRGKVLYALGRLEAALFSFDRAMEFAPEDGDLLYWRGIILHDLQRPEAALASFDQALVFQPEEAITYHLRANVLDELGRLPEALADYDRVLAHQPALSDAHHRRGKVLLKLKRLPEALAAFDRAIQTGEASAEKCNDRGNVLRLLGRFDEARRDALEAVRLDPEFSYAYGTLAEIQAQSGDRAGFFHYIEMALDKGCPVWDLLQDPAYAALGNDTRFRALLASYRRRSVQAH